MVHLKGNCPTALATIAVALLFSAHPISLYADTVDIWTIGAGTQLAGGADISGSFEYDATSNTYSDVNVVVGDDPTTYIYSGLDVPGDTYVTPDVIDPNSGQLSLFDTNTGTELDLVFFSPLTDAGGPDAMGLHLLTGGTLVDYEAPGYDPYNASISGAATPEPGTLFTLTLGLLAFPLKKMSAGRNRIKS